MQDLQAVAVVENAESDKLNAVQAPPAADCSTFVAMKTEHSCQSISLVETGGLMYHHVRRVRESRKLYISLESLMLSTVWSVSKFQEQQEASPS